MSGRTAQERSSSTLRSAAELDAMYDLMRVHDVTYGLGRLECVDLGITPRSVGFTIDLWTHTYPGEADVASRAERCRRLYDAIRYVVAASLANVDGLHDACVRFEPWNSRMERSAVESLEIRIRIEVDHLVWTDSAPSDASLLALASAVRSSLGRYGIGARAAHPGA